jgi:serine phosphatase RsbU (regulator of sigma subunit)
MARQIHGPSLPQDILNRIEVDPVFRFISLDGRFWLDPFTGEPIPLKQDFLSTAQHHLVSSATWRKGMTLPRKELWRKLWLIDLPGLVQKEPRTRLFLPEQRGWLAPCCGMVVDEVRLEHGKLGRSTIEAMAEHLSGCPIGQSRKIRNSDDLIRRFNSLAPKAQLPVDDAANKELNQAIRVQRNMMAMPPSLPEWTFALHFSGQQGVSGDFYEFLTLADGRLLLLLADVTGHGIQGALIVASALKTLRMLARGHIDLIDLMARLADEMRPDLVPGQFITCFAAILNPKTREVECLCAGHHPALIANPKGPVILRKVGTPGVAIGLLAGNRLRTSWRTETTILAEGDILLQYSDGLSELMNGSNEEFGEERCFATICEHLSSSPQDLVDALVSRGIAFSGGQMSDDLTLWALAPVRVEPLT